MDGDGALLLLAGHLAGHGETGSVRLVDPVLPSFLGRFQDFEPVGYAAAALGGWNVSVRVGGGFVHFSRGRRAGWAARYRLGNPFAPLSVAALLQGRQSLEN